MFGAPDYQHRSVTLLNVPAYLVSRSIDPVEFLRIVNVPAWCFSDINAFIPREICFALEDKLQKLTGDDILGANIASQYQVSELGPWGNAIVSAGTLREALYFAVTQIHILQTGFALTAFRDGNSMIVAFNFEGGSAYTPIQHILASTIVFRKVALLAGAREAVQVMLQRPYSSELSNLEQLAGPQIQFGARYDGIQIDLSVIDIPLMGKATEVRPSVQTAWDVTSHIRKLLPYRRVTKDYISTLLGASPRTVQRRLSEWGMSYEQLLDDVRRAEALRLIEDARLTISDIAALVGYSDGPHFVRAFRRWTGVTPKTFRRMSLAQQLTKIGEQHDLV